MALSRLSLHKHIRRLQDLRSNRCKRHLLGDILTIAVCAALADANTWPDIETFGCQRLDWLQRFLELPNGIPSHDTFEQVFDRLQPQALQTALLGWLYEIRAALGFYHIIIDGKTLRHSGNGSSPLRYLHLVSAWAVEANLTLGQVATDEKSNKIEAIPRLLELLDMRGALVSIDAMGCQKAIRGYVTRCMRRWRRGTGVRRSVFTNGFMSRRWLAPVLCTKRCESRINGLSSFS